MNILVIQQCESLSLKGKMDFPEVVRKLMEIGVSSYYTDLIRLQKTFYTTQGETHVEVLNLDPSEIAEEFFQEGIKSAIQSIQKKDIDYPEFLRKITNSGVFSYLVFIQGKKTIYFGKNGDFHIENFPQRKP